jgi:hypothetical protein
MWCVLCLALLGDPRSERSGGDRDYVSSGKDEKLEYGHIRCQFPDWRIIGKPRGRPLHGGYAMEMAVRLPVR